LNFASSSRFQITTKPDASQSAFYAVQQTQHLAQKKARPRPNPQDRAANLDRRCARTALVFRHYRNEIRRDKAGMGNRG
jgi:hypothetical protein